MPKLPSIRSVLSMMFLSVAVGLAHAASSSASTVTPPAEPAAVQIWEALTSIHPAASKPNKEVKAAISKPVDVAGFTVINEFNEGEITEFLLTRSPGGCIHVPLPPPNNMIHVVMQKGKTTANYFGKRVIVHGVVSMGGRIDSSYEMIADSVKEFPF